jgi:diguanylate cyclase
MKTVLIVDDEMFMRRLLEKSLERCGARLLTAASGDEALALMAAQPVDLLVIDINMPGRDGYATVAALRVDPRYAGLPVILLTGGGLGDAPTRAAELAVAAFFTKPFSPSALAAQARELLA